jgi:hypothetical protein
MKRTFVLLVGMLLMTGVIASAEIGFNLGDGVTSPDLASLIAPDLAITILPNTMLLNEPVSSVNIATPIVLPEPTAGTLLLISIAVGGWCRRRQQRQS